MTTNYEDVLRAEIASAFQTDAASLQPVLSELPHDDAQIFSLFDGVSSDNDALDFSTVFGQILTAQSPGPLLEIAKQNFAQPSNWLTVGKQQIARYTPIRSDIVRAIDNGRSIDHKSDARHQTGFSGSSVSGPGFELLPKGIDWTNTQIRSFQLDIDHAAQMSVRQGSWFNPGVFAMAYKSKNWVPNPTHTTWDSVFGPHGALKRIPTGVLVGAGLTLQMTITSLDHKDMAANPAWPFAEVVQGGSSTTEMTLDITVTTPPSVPLLLGFQVQTVAALLG